MLGRMARTRDLDVDVDVVVARKELDEAAPVGRRARTSELGQTIYRHALATAASDRLHRTDRVAALVAAVLGQPGAPLPAEVRRRLEAAVNANLGHVHVHTGAAANAAAAAVGARAFAVGDELVFADGAYAPGTEAGEWLLAHEATHAARHRGEATEAAESEASAIADAHVGTRRRSADPEHRLAIEQMLRDAGVAVGSEDVDRLAIQFGDGLAITRWSLGAENQNAVAHVARLVEHARGHQCPTGCEHPAHVEKLDAATRKTVENTTGIALGDVIVQRDAAMAADHLGETTGNVIRLAPGLPGAEDPLGRQVRVHEAMHVAQGKVATTGAPVAAVEAEAHAATDAAARGERQPLSAGTAPGEAYAFSLADAAKALGVDPMGFVREHFPQIASFFQGGFEPMLQKLGDAAGTALKPVLDGVGITALQSGFASLTSAFKPGEGHGILNGCCECLDHALAGLLKSVKGALDSDTAKTLKHWIDLAQEASNNSIIDTLFDFFDTLKTFGGPVLGAIQQVGVWIDQANTAVGGSLIWKTLAPLFGLDGSLTPIDAIKKKLSELWEGVKKTVEGVKAVIAAVWTAIKQDPVVAAIIKLVTDCGKLWDAIKKVRDAKSKDPQVWLGILAKEMKGTIFSGLIDALKSGYDTAGSLKDTVTGYVMRILGAMGVLSAWNAAVPYLNAIGTVLKSWAKTIQDAFIAIKTAVVKAIDDLTAELKSIWTGIKPYVDFVVGLGVAIALTASGQIWAIPSFVIGQLWLHVLPHCYKESLTTFLLDLFIMLVGWFPAKHPIMIVVRSATLSFLQTIKAAPMEKKIGAMDTIAKVMSFDVEVVAGFFVGVVEGLWNSSLGFIVQAALFPLQMIGGLLLTVAEKLGSVVGKGFGDVFAGASWIVDAMANAKKVDPSGKGGPAPGGGGGGGGGATTTPGSPTPGGTSPTPGQPDPAAPQPTIQTPATVTASAPPTSSTGEDSPDPPASAGPAARPPAAPPGTPPAGATPAPGGAEPGTLPPGGPLFEGFPSFPSLPPTGALLDKVFHKGITRAEIEEMFKKFNLALDSMGTKVGAEAANKLLPFLNSSAAPYDIGEILGEVVGWLAGEIIMLVFTEGVENAIAKVTEELFDGAKLLERIGEMFPKLIEWLEDLKKSLAPAIEAFEKISEEVAKFFKKVKSWVEEVIAWVKRQGERLMKWLEETFGELGKMARKALNWLVKEEGEIEVELEAEAAAEAAFLEVDAMVHGAAVSHGAMEAKLREVKVPHTPDVHITLKLETLGEWWSIKATGTKGDKRGVGQAVGRGAILWSEELVPYYTAGAHGIRHAEILEAAYLKLESEARALEETEGKEETLHTAYEQVQRIAQATQREGQSQLPLANTHFYIRLEAENTPDVQEQGISETTFIITPNTKKKKKPIHIYKSQKSCLGAVKANGLFKGSFDPAQKVGKPKTSWNWDGYPSGPITQHPANVFLGYRNAHTLGSLKPPETTYNFIGGDTPGGKHKKQWTTELALRVENKALDLQAANPTLSPTAAKTQAKAALLAEYHTNFNATLTWEDVELNGGRRWEAHHIWENSWGGGQERSNFQYLAFTDEHHAFSKFWNNRARDIKTGLGI